MCVANNALQSLFQKAVFSINDREIDANQNYANYKGIVQAHFSYSANALQMLRPDWCTDGGDDPSSTTLTANTGAFQRANWTASGRTLHMYGRPPCDMIQQSKALPPNTKLSIRLNR